MRDNFYVVLPSNSSASYFPDNTTTHFITRLPHQLRLQGEWGVSLTDIQIPMTFLHLPKDEKTIVRRNSTLTFEALKDNEKYYSDTSTPFEEKGEELTINRLESRLEEHYIVPRGLYHSIDDLIKTVNETSLKDHVTFTINRNGYVSAQRSCTHCINNEHTFYLSSTLARILGYDEGEYNMSSDETSWVSSRPGSLIRALPTMMFVYTDICESYITGDVRTPLLRTVPLDVESYVYGSIKYKSFSTSKYIPLLHTDLQTIEIDIRNEFGQPIPFEYGTLTVTLHFKRLD